jgi:microcystin-dependent protein
MVVTPKAVRVRTASGWQDIALRGPPGGGDPVHLAGGFRTGGVLVDGFMRGLFDDTDRVAASLPIDAIGPGKTYTQFRVIGAVNCTAVNGSTNWNVELGLWRPFIDSNFLMSTGVIGLALAVQVTHIDTGWLTIPAQHPSISYGAHLGYRFNALTAIPTVAHLAMSFWVRAPQALSTPMGALVGAPIPWLVSAIPSGYLEFNGQAITQAVYPQLYALFGGNLPDLRDKFLLGASGTYGVGTTGGEVNHILNTTEMPSHTHVQNSHFHTDIGAFVNLQPSISGGNTLGYGIGAAGVQAVAAATPTNQNAGGGGAHNNMPPYRAVRWITVAG